MVTFQPELAAAVMAGTKTVTRRLCSDNPRSPWYHERCAYQPGRSYAVQPGRGKPAIGRALFVSVARQPLGQLDDEEARREGFTDPAAFKLGNKRERVRQLGNAVTPPAARDLIAAIVEALLAEEVAIVG